MIVFLAALALSFALAFASGRVLCPAFLAAARRLPAGLYDTPLTTIAFGSVGVCLGSLGAAIKAISEMLANGAAPSDIPALWGTSMRELHPGPAVLGTASAGTLLAAARILAGFVAGALGLVWAARPHKAALTEVGVL